MEYAKRIDQHGGQVIKDIVEEVHKSQSVSHQGPTAAFAALVAITISIATSGTGASLGAKITTSAILQGMTEIAFTSICSTAGVALLQANGDFGKAAQSLVSEDNLKNLGIALVIGGGSGSKGFLDTLGAKLIQNTASSVLHKVVKNENLEKGLVSGAINSVIGSTLQVGATKIGDLKSKGAIDSSMQKIIHGGLGVLGGTVTGLVTKQDLGKSALSGGVGAVIGETVAELTFSKKIGDFIATTTAFGLELDPTIAYTSSDNATKHNWQAHRHEEKEDTSEDVVEKKTKEKKSFECGREIFIENTLKQAEKARGRPLRKSSFDAVVERADEFYCKSYGSNQALIATGNLIGQGIVTTSEILPGVSGVNQAWMGLVNHVRGNLPEGALQDEILSGLQSSLNDVAIGMASFGVFKAVSGASKFVKEVKSAFKDTQKIANPNIGYWKKKTKTESGKVDGKIKDWLGESYKTLANKSGDKIFISQDRQRKIRFDIKNSHGDKPHIHKDAVKNIHRIYPKE